MNKIVLTVLMIAPITLISSEQTSESSLSRSSSISSLTTSSPQKLTMDTILNHAQNFNDVRLTEYVTTLIEFMSEREFQVSELERSNQNLVTKALQEHTQQQIIERKLQNLNTKLTDKNNKLEREIERLQGIQNFKQKALNQQARILETTKAEIDSITKEKKALEIRLSKERSRKIPLLILFSGMAFIAGKYGSNLNMLLKK